MSADSISTTPALSAEGVNVTALSRAMEQWLESDPARTARMLCDHSGVHERGIWQIRTGKRPHCSFDWADRLCLAMDIDLLQIAPLDVPLAKRRRNRSGKPLGKHLQHISPGDLKLAHDLHWRGVPLRRIARTWQATGRITYAGEEAAVNSLYKAFELRGWPRRDRIEMVRLVSTKHGRAGREQARQYGPDYAAYRREQRKRNGDLRDIPCAAQNKNGDPCKRWAITDRSYCVTHDPARQGDRQRIMESAWAASRARMLRWGDLCGEVHRAIELHGRPALARTSGVSATVLSRMLRYAEDQPVKPETWAKLESGMAALPLVSSTRIHPLDALR